MACQLRARLQSAPGGTQLLVRLTRRRTEGRILRRTPPHAVTLLAALLLAATAFAGRAPVLFDAPAPPAGAVAVGTAHFGMGAVTAPDHIRALALPGEVEVPLTVLAFTPWPDGSLMSAEVAFLLEPAPDRGARELAPLPDGPFPTFSLAPELDDMQPVMDVSLGQIMVRLDAHPEYYYYWYLIPIAAILALLIYRKARLR